MMIKNLILLVTLCLIMVKINAVETRIKIGMIDTGVTRKQAKSPYMCENGVKSMLKNNKGYDDHGHGENIFGLIVKGLDPKTHCIISYKFFSPFRNVNTFETVSKAVLTSIDDGVKYLNLSLSGTGYTKNELIAVKKALESNITLIVAAGNNGANLDKKCIYYPACYKNFKIKNIKNLIVVGAYDLLESNYGAVVNVYMPGSRVGIPVKSGTSQATALYTNFYIKKNK